MKILIGVVLLAVLAVVAAGLFVRFAPVSPARWHVDPLTVEIPNKDNHFILRPQGGDGRSPIFQADPATIARALQDLIRESPRAALIAGSAEEGHFTVIERSRLVGFPDFVTVKIFETDGGTALAIFSRSQYGYSDMGVNKARVERWLQSLDARLKR